MFSRNQRSLFVALVLFVLALVLAAGCQGLTGGGGGGGTSTLPAPGTGGEMKGTPQAPSDSARSRSAVTAEQPSTSAVKTPPMVIRDKTLTMEVKSVRKTLATLSSMTGKYGASITNTSISSQDGGPIVPEEPQRRKPATDTGPLSGTIVIKIPAARFDAFAAEARKLGKIQAESESAQDVTQQAVDMRARLKNLRAEEAAFIRFFKAATTVRELISIESQLARVRGEIESLQAQLDLLESRVALATLTLQLSEPADIVSPGGIDWGVGAAFTQAIRNFVGVINFLIQMTGALLPLLIIGALGVWLVRWFLGRFVFKTNEGQKAPESQ